MFYLNSSIPRQKKRDCSTASAYSTMASIWPVAVVVGECTKNPKELKQTTTTTATRTPPKKTFNEHNNSYVCTLYIFVHFFPVLCKTTTWNDEVLRSLRNANDATTANFSHFHWKLSADTVALELKQTTTATAMATGTSQNKRFNDENSSRARAL